MKRQSHGRLQLCGELLSNQKVHSGSCRSSLDEGLSLSWLQVSVVFLSAAQKSQHYIKAGLRAVQCLSWIPHNACPGSNAIQQSSDTTSQLLHIKSLMVSV